MTPTGRRAASRLLAFPCGRERFDAAVFDAFDPRVGTPIDIPYFFFLIDHPDALILFDTGVHADLARDPARRLGPDAAKWDLRVTEDEIAERLLAGAGVACGDVTHVALSHLHYDHAGGLSQFPDARIVVQRAELEFARDPPVFQRDIYVADDFELPLDWQLVDGTCDLLGDGSIVLFPTPGHTAGHQSMHVHLAGGDVLLVADAAYTPEKLATHTLPTGALVWRSDAAVASHLAITDRAVRTGAEVVCSHDPDYRERVRIAPTDWYT